MRRAMSFVLTAVMLLSLLPVFSLPASAAEDDISSMNALDALGIDTSAMPDGFDANSVENPYGRDSVTVNPVYELFVHASGLTKDSESSAVDIEGGSRITTVDTYTINNTLYGSNKPLSGTMSNFYQNQAVTTQTAEEAYHVTTVTDEVSGNSTVVSTDTTTASVATASAAGHFVIDPENATPAEKGTTGQIATVSAGALDKNGGLYLSFTDAAASTASGDVKTLLDTSATIGNGGNQMEEDFVESPYLMQNYLQIAAGDYNNDGRDEIAVYVPEQGNSRVEIYKLAVKSDSQANDYLDGDNWIKVWTYYFNEAPFVSNMVSLTSGDFNQDGTDDLALTWGYYYGPGKDEHNDCQAVVLFGSGTIMFQSRQTIALTYNPDGSNTAGIVRAAFTYGDIDGDNVDDLILGGQLTSDIAANNVKTRFMAVYSYDGTTGKFIQSLAKNFDLFEQKDGSYVNQAMSRDSSNPNKDKYYSSPACVANITAVNMNGVGQAAYIYLDSLLIEYGNEGLVIKMPLDVNTNFNKNVADANNYQKYYAEYGVVAADFTGDGKETLQVMQYYYPSIKTEPLYLFWWWKWLGISVSIPENVPADLDMMAVYGDSDSIAARRWDATFATSFCTANTDQDTSLLKYTNTHYVRYSDPEVLAVISSPPYFADLDNDALGGSYMESETSYTSSSGSGSGGSTSHTLNIGAYVSFEHDFEVFDVKVASVQAEASYEHGWTWETTNTSTLEQSVSYSTVAGEDAVAFYSIPMEVYVYQSYVPIIDDGGNFQGYDEQYMSVNIPHIASVKVLPLATYEKIAADYPELPQIAGSILTHTVGDPGTYPSSTAGYSGAVAYSGTPSGVGFGNNSSTQEISMTSEQEKSFINTNTVEIKAGAGPGDFVFGVSAGYEYGSSQVTTTISGSTFSGQVYNMPIEAEPYNYNYVWRIFCFEYSGGGVRFPVVDYVVNDVTAPPKLPTDFQQDISLTTDSEIALTWSYKGAAAGFQLYRYYEFPDGSGSYELKFVAASETVGADADGTRYYRYIDNGGGAGLNPYTAYDYQIQVIGASVPTDSILSAVYTAKTKSAVGYPSIQLSGVTDGSLLVYPDSVSKVSVTVYDSGTGKLYGDVQEDPKYQWQRLTEDGWTDLEGAIGSSYTFRNAGLSNEGQYRCRVNVIYQTDHQIYYISAYSDVFTLEYAKRTPMIAEDEAENLRFTVEDVTVGEGADEKTVPKISVYLKSAHPDHYLLPTGTVTFEVVGADYDRSFTAALGEAAGESGIAAATVTLDDPLPDGAYEITASYSGNRVYKGLVSAEPIVYLSGTGSGYVLTLDSSYTYGDAIAPTLKSLTKTDGVTTGEAVSATYRVIQYTGSWYFDWTRFPYIFYKTVEKPMDFGASGALQATKAGTFTLIASAGGTDVASKEFTVEPRDVTIGFTQSSYSGVAGTASHPTDTILAVADGSLALATIDGVQDAIGDLGLRVKATNTAGTEVTFRTNKEAEDLDVTKTDPGSYTVVGAPGAVTDKYYNYNITYETATYILTGPKYGVTGVAKELNGRPVGTLEIVSPAGNVPWSTEYAASTTLVFLATPNAGYAVKSWNIASTAEGGNTNISPDSGGGTSTRLTHQMQDEGVIVTVEFEVAQTTLSYRAGEPGTGTVVCTSSSAAQSGDVAMEGAEFTFQAIPAEGYHFVGWQLNEIGRNPSEPEDVLDAAGNHTCTITMGTGNTTLYAVFARDSYTLNLTGDLQATYTVINKVTGNYDVTVYDGEKVSGDTYLTVTAKPGYEVLPDAVWTQDGENAPVAAGSQSYTFQILADTAIAVETQNLRFSVGLSVSGPGSDVNTASATIGGSAISNMNDVPGGSTVVFHATPAYGYVFDHWVFSGSAGTADGATLTISALSGNTTVEAVFANNESYDVTVVYGQRGSVSYTLNGGESMSVASGGTISVFKGDTVVLTAAPKINFMVENWTIDGELEQTYVKTKTFADIQASINVVVAFGAQTYSTVTYGVSSGGGIIAAATSDGVAFESGSNSVGKGSALAFTAAPDDGKMVEKWTLNGVTVLNELGGTFVGKTYTIPALSVSNAAILVYFKDTVAHTVTLGDTHTTTADLYEPEDSLLSSTPTTTVRDGATATFTVTPEAGYRITSAGVTGNTGAAGLNGFDSVEKLDDGSWVCIVYAVTDDLTVTAQAGALYSITVPAAPVGGNVVIRPLNGLALEGDTVTLTATARAGYTFDKWTVTGVTLSEADLEKSTVSFPMPAQNVTVAASFTSTGGGGGGGGGAVADDTIGPDDFTYSGGQVLVTLTDEKYVLSEEAMEKLIELNRTQDIVISGNGLHILIPAGTLRDGDDINAMLPAFPPVAGGTGRVVIYTDASGVQHVLPWSVVTDGLISFIAAGGGTYQVVDAAVAFGDTAGHWGEDAIGFVSARALFLGTGGDGFSPDADMSRAMLVTVLHRLDGLTRGGSFVFPDVGSGQWYTDAVAWAAENGIVGGYDNGDFGTGDSITREQLATMLYRYAGYLGLDTSAAGDLAAFPDAGSVSGYAQQAMLWATENGIITGRSGGLLDSAGHASRAEVATMLMRLVDLVV